MSEEQVNLNEENKNGSTSSKNDNSKVCAILSYLLIGVVWYFVDDTLKKDDFAKFHVKQSLVLLIANVLANAILMVLPVLGWILIPFLNLFIIVLAIKGMITAINGEKKELPYIGKYASKLKF